MSVSSTSVALPAQDQIPARRSAWQRRRRDSIPYLFLAPFGILFIAFFLAPILYAFRLSLYTLHRHPSLNGATSFTVFSWFDQYRRAFTDSDFITGLEHMVAFGLIQVPVMLILALTFALLLDSAVVRFKPFFRLAYFIPFAIPGVVATLLWGYFYTPSLSPVIGAWTRLGLTAPSFFIPVSHLLASVGNVVTWEWAGYNMIIITASLQSISTEIYEAAGLDGCGGWRTAWYIKVPMVRPALILTTIFSIIGTLQLFNEFSVFNTGGLASVDANVTPNYYAYTQAFQYNDFNYAATISFSLAIVTFIFSIAFLRLTNRRAD